jgi:hypothetical protein
MARAASQVITMKAIFLSKFLHYGEATFKKNSMNNVIALIFSTPTLPDRNIIY